MNTPESFGDAPVAARVAPAECLEKSVSHVESRLEGGEYVARFRLQLDALVRDGCSGREAESDHRPPGSFLRDFVACSLPGQAIRVDLQTDGRGGLDWELGGEARSAVSTAVAEGSASDMMGGLQELCRGTGLGIQLKPKAMARAGATDALPNGALVSRLVPIKWFPPESRRVELGFATPREPVARSTIQLPVMRRGTLRVSMSVPEFLRSLGIRLGVTLMLSRRQLTAAEHAEVHDAIGDLRACSSRGLRSAEVEAQVEWLERWLKESEGVQVDCRVQSQRAVPHAVATALGIEVFGMPSKLESIATGKRSGIDLRNCRPASEPLPGLFPGLARLKATGVRTQYTLVPSRLSEEGVVLGCVGDGDFQTEVRLNHISRARHCYITGATGTGKSTLLINLIRQDIEAGHGLAVIDPHGDLFDEVLNGIPRHRCKDVTLLNVTDTSRAMGLNPLDVHGPDRAMRVNLIVNEFLHFFQSRYDMRQVAGPMFELYFRCAILLLAHQPRCRTLIEMPDLFQSADFRKGLLETCTDGTTIMQWRNLERVRGEACLDQLGPYIYSKLNPLLHNPSIRCMLVQSRNALDLPAIMNRKGVLLVNLCKTRLGESDAGFLGSLLINKVFLAGLTRATLPPARRVPFHLYVDEFQNFAGPSMTGLICESRKFGLHATLANQHLGQLRHHNGGPDLAETVLGNVGNLICFRSGPSDASALAPFLRPQIGEQDLQNLPNYHAVARLLTDEGTTPAFVIRTLPVPDQHLDPEIRRSIRRRWMRASVPADCDAGKKNERRQRTDEDGCDALAMGAKQTIGRDAVAEQATQPRGRTIMSMQDVEDLLAGTKPTPHLNPL
jgi:hypothetical protein